MAALIECARLGKACLQALPNPISTIPAKMGALVPKLTLHKREGLVQHPRTPDVKTGVFAEVQGEPKSTELPFCKVRCLGTE